MPNPNNTKNQRNQKVTLIKETKMGGETQAKRTTANQGENVKPLKPLSRNINANTKANSFLEFCNQYRFVGFSFTSIQTKINENGEMKKFPQKMPAWKDFEYNLNQNQVSASHSAFAIITGAKSNITVIDCDSHSSYQSLTSDYPQLLDTLTIASPRGFHIYCRYEQGITSNSQSFRSYPDVDIRNDVAIIFAPPSSFVNCVTKSTETYSIEKRLELVSFPLALKRDLKDNTMRVIRKTKPCLLAPSLPDIAQGNNHSLDQFSDSESSSRESFDEIHMLSEELDQSQEDSTDISDRKVKPFVADKVDDDGDLCTSLTSASFQGQNKQHPCSSIPTTEHEIVDLLNALPDSHLNGWNNWFKVGAILFHELGDTQHTKDLFLLHSRRAPLYTHSVTMNDVDVIWKRFKEKPAKDGTTSVATVATLYHWCKALNSKRFRKIQRKYQPFDFSLVTTTNLAKFFIKLYGSDFIQSNGHLFFWDGNLWNKRIAQHQLMKMIGSNLYDDLLHQAKRCHKQNTDALKVTVQSLISIQNRPYKENIMKDILTELPQLDDIEFDVNAAQIDNLHFRNGVLMLDKVKWINNNNDLSLSSSISIVDAFRSRNKNDYVSQVLPYDFAVPSTDHIRNVLNIFKQIQPDQQQRDFQLGWSAYTLTGRTSEQKFKMNIGYTAANGKSTELKIHEAAFSIYTMKLDKRTFNENNTKQHKQFIHLINNPIRLAYIEEMDRNKLDADLLKDFVDGHKLNVEIMFGTSVAKGIQAKFSACSNKDMNVEADRGILRRGLVQHYTSQFVTHPDPMVPNQFTLFRDTEKNFQTDDDFKRAYLWVLLPYVIGYYGRCCALDIPSFATEQFRAIAEEYDSFKNALMEICIDGCADDRIYKDDLVQELQEKLKRKNLTFNQVLVELKRLGYKYECQKRVKSKYDHTNVSHKGAICGLKWNPESVQLNSIFFQEENDTDDSNRNVDIGGTVISKAQSTKII
jgi:hypothetical protein